MKERKGQGFSSDGLKTGKQDPQSLEAIQRRTPKVAGRVELHHTPAGTIATPYTPRERKVYREPFHPVAFVENKALTTNTNAVLAPAWVMLRHVENKDNADGTAAESGAISFKEPAINAVGLWTQPPPELSLAGERSFNYLSFNTNPLGFPTTEFNIVSTTNKLNSVYHIPPDADGGNSVDGEYNILLFDTDLDNPDYHEKVHLHWGGHLPWYGDLWAGEHPNLGGAQPFIGFAENINRYHFRTHYGGHATNITQDAVGYSNAILHEWCGRNIGSGVNIANVYTGNTAKGCAEFNRICERDTNPQVSVIQANNESPIKIQGNNKDLTVNFRNCTNHTVYSLTFIDGLVTKEGTVTIQLGDCTNGAPS